jgi:O-antigen ligase
VNRIALWALAVFVFSIPSENGVAIAGVGSLSRLLGAFAFGMGLASLFGQGRLRFRVPSLFLVATLAFSVWGVATYFWSLAPQVTMGRIVTMAQLAVLVWLVHQVARSERDRDVLMHAFVLGCYLIIAIGVTTFVTGAGGGFRDVGNFNPNGFAIVSALGIPMAWSLLLRRSFPRMQVLHALYPLFAIVAVVLAASRGGFVTALVALAIIPLTMSRLGAWRRLALFATVALASLAAFAWVPQAFPTIEQNIARLSETDEELLGGTLTGRTNIWSAGVEAFLGDPVQGTGMGTFNQAIVPYYGRPRSPHNAFLSVAVGTGLIGLILFVALIAIVLIGVLARSERRLEYLVLLTALVVGMMPTNSDNDKFVWLILGLLASARPILIHVEGGARTAIDGVGTLLPRPRAAGGFHPVVEASGSTADRSMRRDEGLGRFGRAP